MGAITFSDFSSGLDLRKGASVSDANRLRDMTNCYVTTGKTIRKRPGLSLFATLENGTKGLRSAGGKLNTFYATGSVTHADSRFVANKITHPTNATVEVKNIHYADVFNGYLYVSVEYNNGEIKHHYIDNPAILTAWEASTVLTLGAIRRPAVNNGYRYEVTAAGTTDAAEPTWPTTIGATVTDGTVVFTCRGTEVWDTNCPHTAAVIKKSSKIFAVDDDVVRFCKTSNPRNWTESSDAGFLGVGIQQSGSTNPTALGEYSGNLVVFFRDSAQVWLVDPDPAKMSFIQGIDAGCPYQHGASNMAGDVFFTSYDGIRSITTQSTTGNMIDVDAGSPIDSLIKQSFGVNDDIRAFYFRGGGQYWAMNGNVAFVYSFSRTSKISAWSKYVFPFNITDVTELDGDLYFRAGNTVYKLDENAYSDAGVDFDVTIEFPYLDFKTPGVMKQILGMDSVMIGSADMQIKFDSRNPSAITPEIRMTGDTRPGEMTAVEVVSVGIAPVITATNDQPFELHALTFYYQNLASIS